MEEKVNDFEKEKQKKKFNFFACSYAQKKAIKYFLAYIFISTGGLILSFYLIIIGVSEIINKPNNANSLVARDWASFFIGSFFTLATLWFFKNSDYILDGILKKFNNAEKGVKGENLVFSEFEKILNKNQYKVIKNFKINGEKSNFDIDALIIGPKGFVIVEIKNLTGNFLFAGKYVYKQNPYNLNCWCRLNKSNPITQIINHADLFKKFLN